MVPFRILLTAIVFQYHFTLLILLYHDNCATNIKRILTKSKCEQGINIAGNTDFILFLFFAAGTTVTSMRMRTTQSRGHTRSVLAVRWFDLDWAIHLKEGKSCYVRKPEFI